MYYNQNKLYNRNSFIGSNFQFNSPIKLENPIPFYKNGNKIHIKKENRGKFTDYCNGKVTNTCIQKGKNSPDPKIRKRATFAANARTWKHQLGGIIKFIQKISPKLASKARGRLLSSRIGQVKEFKTPYIFPGQLGWSPAETRTVWHRTNNPNFKIERKHKGRWDADTHGAPENGLWVSEKKDIGFMNDRPILVQLQQALKKPIVQIGDIPTQGKNNMRNYILREAEQSGADAVKFKGIKDNKTSNQNVTFIFEPTISATVAPKEMDTFNKQVSRLEPQEIKTQALQGVKDLMMGFMSPKWEQKALSRELTKQEVEAFQNLQGRALTTKLPMSGKFGPLDVRLENLDEGIQGYSQFFNNSIHNKKFPSEHFIAISNQATHPYYSAIHEGMHHGTFNIGAPGWINPQIPLSPIEESALNKVIRNAKALSDKLEVDPTKYNKVLKKLQTNLGMSKTEAKNFLDGKIKYWKNEQESRARAGALNKYIENNPNASERELVSIDNGRYVFTDESLKNLYNKTIALGLPIVGGSLALKQLENEN